MSSNKAKTRLPPGRYQFRVEDAISYPDPGPERCRRRLRLILATHRRDSKGKLRRVPTCKRIDQYVYLRPNGTPDDERSEKMLTALCLALPLSIAAQETAPIGRWIEADRGEPTEDGYYALDNLEPFQPDADELGAPPIETGTDFRPAPTPNETQCRHSPDFRSVHWFGVAYFFTETQAACVALLWEAWSNGTPELGQMYILEHQKVDARSGKLADLFKNSAAWGTMVVPGNTRGSFQLAEPKD